MRRFVLLLTFFLLSVAPALAQSQTYTTTTTARVRAEASTTSAIVARLRANTVVTVVDQVDGERYNRSTLWYAVRLADGTEGYIHSSLLRLGSSPVPASNTVSIGSTASTPVPTLASSAAQSTPAPNPPIPPPASSTCNGQDDLNCSDFANSSAATAHLQQCGDEDRLDRDHDGVACE